jgi:hypothetical protein
MKKEDEVMTPYEKEMLLLEQRKTKAMEKISKSLDALTVWFEEIDKHDWDQRMQYYLGEFYKMRKTELGIEDDKEE